MENGKDKRRAKRVSYVCEIQCEGIGIGILNTRINDISVSGLFIDTISHLPVGALLYLRFTVLGYSIRVEGEVRYCMPQVGMGIQFTNLKPEDRYLIECLVERNPVDEAQFAALAATPIADDPAATSASQAAPTMATSVAADSEDDEAYPQTRTEVDIVEESEVDVAAESETDFEDEEEYSYVAPTPMSAAEIQMLEDEAIILMGNFAVINLFDVIQVIENSRVSGELISALPVGSMVIYFNEGRIANAEADEYDGVDALNAMLDITQGAFKFRKTDLEYTSIIETVSNTGLLLDLLANKDEATNDVDFY